MRMERKLKILILLGSCLFSILVLVHPQDQSGFVSIDCGSTRSYSDVTTGITYVPDEGFIDTGVSSKTSTQYNQNGVPTQFANVRSFPDGNRNCYTLIPEQVDGTRYLIRAQFMYGNYDSMSRVPEFDLHIGVNLWDTISFGKIDEIVTAEIIHVPSSGGTNVCLVNTNLGTPFISVLEMRLMTNVVNTYETLTGTMNLFFRYNLGTYSTDDVRFGDDLYDRIWKPIDFSHKMDYLNTTLPINNKGSYSPAAKVLSTAITPKNASNWLQFYWPSDIETQYYIYMHFAELSILSANESRQFDIYLNSTQYYTGMIPTYLSVFTIYTPRPQRGQWFNFSFRMTDNATLPPILNAIEVYTLNPMLEKGTNYSDVESINKIKSTYGVKKFWQGDPCAPNNFTWDGLGCSYPDRKLPRITSLNLSWSNLVGQISQNFSGLELLENLDLSNNQLSGSIPEFLSNMKFLKVLNLKGNNLTGTVPSLLVEKNRTGTLLLSVDGNLCTSSSCSNTTFPVPTDGKKNSSLIPIISSVAGVLVLLLVVFAVVIICVLKKKKTQDGIDTKVTNETFDNDKGTFTKQNDHTLSTGNQKFTYSQILTMTNNFERSIGKGGFGTVYHGYLNGVQVAVKMLSPSSSQGYKEFQAEAQVLMRVHHRNLTLLIGYCDEGDKLGLVYEYMANGNLETNLSSKNPQYLTWEDRLFIAVDAAQGLEYLHHGCKPPIVHRDIKSPNILLDDQFHAKIADFGLSRVSPIDGGDEDYVPTVVAGTPGYLDPEYYNTQTLNEKSDVYAFGVVLHEIITSQPVISRTPDKTHLCKKVSHILSTTGNIKSVVDPRLQGDYEINSVWKAIEIAMACVLPLSNQRPEMARVVNELSQCLKMERERKNDLYSSRATVDTIEMVSMEMNSGLMPVAR